jgi:hypothetical protein
VSLEEALSHVTFELVLMFCALLPCLALREILAVYRICAARHHQKAEQKALALLKEWLLPTQLAQYESNGCFEVVGSHSGNRYRIRPAAHMNVDELGKHGERITTLCFGPRGYLPVSDLMLAQKIALETDERAALQIANSNC